MDIGYILDGRYQILSLLGEGGMSRVYLARHLRLKTLWAVREIRREFCENYALMKGQIIREMEILRKLDHPGLPEIIDILQTGEMICVVMEYIEGMTLKELVEEKGKPGEDRVLAIAEDLCGIFIYLHGRKPPVIYRDLKPSNIMTRKNGSLVLIDFGAAVEYREGDRDDRSLGTRGYAAPEQFGGWGRVDERSDLYAFGMTLACLLTGRSPDQPPYTLFPIRRWCPEVSGEMEELVRKCTETDPESRYRSFSEMAVDLKHVRACADRQKETDRKKYLGFLVLMLLACICAVTSVTAGIMQKRTRQEFVGMYLERADRETDMEKAASWYAGALEVSPTDYRIYDSMLDHYIIPGFFGPGQGAVLVSLLYAQPAFETLQAVEEESYLEVCYRIGVGYFFEMNGSAGKKESEIWFRAVENSHNKNFDPEKKKRAVCYRKIADYYNRFAGYDSGKSGEEAGDPGDFYRTLRQLNEMDPGKEDSRAKAAVCYQISKEVTLDIGEYGQKFLGQEDITREMLEKELARIDGSGSKRWRLMEKYKSTKEMEDLKMLLADTRRKLQMISRTGGYSHERQMGSRDAWQDRSADHPAECIRRTLCRSGGGSGRIWNPQSDLAAARMDLPKL